MYAIIDDGGKQYRVEQGQELNVELKELAEGVKTVTFDRVLLVGAGETTKVGKPLVAGAKVTATVLSEAKGPKLDTMVFRRRKSSRKAFGHRQHYLRVKIDEIVA
ncbi:MAG: 50S ribosomal protein L21 [Phycisphaerae bacterium]|nr:50S ribosomal protein L21 [Phycisphaerae bacterium]